MSHHVSSTSHTPIAPTVGRPLAISSSTTMLAFSSLPFWRTTSVRRATSLAAAVLCVSTAACGSKPESPSVSTAATDSTRAATLVLGPRDVAQATARPVAAGVYVTGSLDPAETVEIQSQIAGQLGRVLVERGTVVTRGQLLTSFDASAMRAQLSSAEASVAARERDLVAADTLYKRGAASQQDFVNARAATDAARAQLAQARETLDRASVRAPIGGQVSEKFVATGEGVQSGAKLFTIVNGDALELAGQISAADAAAVRVGQPVHLTLEAYPGRTFVGRVARLDAVADQATRQVTVFIRYTNTGASRIVAGLFASGRIQLGSQGAARDTAALVTVPGVAVRTEGNESVVYVIQDGRVRRTPVTVGARDTDADLVQIHSGLVAGTTVLVAPGASPRDNTPVETARNTPADSAAADIRPSKVMPATPTARTKA